MREPGAATLRADGRVPSGGDGPTSPYSQTFYSRNLDASLGSARQVVPLVMSLVAPRRVVDVGCGIGTWLSVFKEHGVGEVRGIDGDWVATEQLLIEADEFQPADLGAPLEVDGRFDLAVSLEVVEHLDAAAAAHLVDSLIRLAPVVLFSAAVPHQGGTHHVNERWQSYWVDRFAARGFVAIDCMRPALWDNEAVAYYYAQNMFVFADQSRLAALPRLLAARDQSRTVPLDLVHPGLVETLARRCREHETQLAELEARCARAADLQPGSVSFAATARALPRLFWHAIKRRLFPEAAAP